MIQSPEKLIIKINNESEIFEVSHEIISNNGLITVNIDCFATEIIYKYALLTGNKFMITIPFCNPVEMILRNFNSYSTVDTATIVKLTFSN